MRYRLLVPSALLLFTALVPAQVVEGFRDLSFPNTTGQGTSSLTARVHYPSSSTGQNTPLETPPAGGYPVIVFLHGFTLLGSQYGMMGDYFAQQGYVAVMSNTAQFSFAVQPLDGIALYSALATANAQTGNFLEGALDMARAGVAGHSMGGGSTVTVLASNPGYAAGVCFAPVDPGASVTGAVDAPLGVIHGQGDPILPWATFGLVVFNQATSFVGHKFLYLFDTSADHTNITGRSLASQADVQVWNRTKTVATGFFDRYLKDDTNGLQQVIGSAAQAEPRLAQLQVRVEAPDVWLGGGSALGQTSEVTLSSEPGPSFLLAAAGPGAAVPTVFGAFLLDPASTLVVLAGDGGPDRIQALPIPIPNDPGLVGAQVSFQALSLDNQGLYRLTGLATLIVTS